jgi:hypothetical protein
MSAPVSYPSEGAARNAALNECREMTAKDGLEHGTAVYQRPDGSYGYDPPVTGGEDNIDIPYDPNDGELRSLVHSHPCDAVEGDMTGDNARVPYYAIETDGDIYRREHGVTTQIYSSPVADDSCC